MSGLFVISDYFVPTILVLLAKHYYCCTTDGGLTVDSTCYFILSVSFGATQENPKISPRWSGTNVLRLVYIYG